MLQVWEPALSSSAFGVVVVVGIFCSAIPMELSSPGTAVLADAGKGVPKTKAEMAVIIARNIASRVCVIRLRSSQVLGGGIL